MSKSLMVLPLVVISLFPSAIFANSGWTYRAQILESRDVSALQSILMSEPYQKSYRWYMSNAIENRFQLGDQRTEAIRDIRKRQQDLIKMNEDLESLLKEQSDSHGYGAVIALEWRMVHSHFILGARKDRPDFSRPTEVRDASGKVITTGTQEYYSTTDPRLLKLAQDMMKPYLSSGNDWVKYYYCWGQSPQERVRISMQYEANVSDSLVKYALAVCRYSAYVQMDNKSLAMQLEQKLPSYRPAGASVGRTLIDDRKRSADSNKRYLEELRRQP